MKVKLNKLDLIEAFSKLRHVTSKPSTTATAGCTLIEPGFECVYMTASSDTETIRVRVPAVIEDENDCDIALNEKTLSSVISRMGDSITISTKKQKATIQSGKSTVTMSGVSSDGFTQRVIVPKHKLQMEGKALGRWVKTTIAFMDKDASTSTAPYCASALWASRPDGLLEITATNRKKFINVPTLVEFVSADRFVVPATSMRLIGDLVVDDHATISLGENSIRLECGDVDLVCPLMECTFPDWRKFVNMFEFFPAFTVPREEFEQACHLAQFLGVDPKLKLPSAMFKFSPGKLCVSALTNVDESESVVESDDIQFTDEVKINPAYMLEGIEAHSGDRLSLEMAKDKRFIRIQNSELLTMVSTINTPVEGVK